MGFSRKRKRIHSTFTYTHTATQPEQPILVNFALYQRADSTKKGMKVTLTIFSLRKVMGRKEKEKKSKEKGSRRERETNRDEINEASDVMSVDEQRTGR